MTKPFLPVGNTNTRELLNRNSDYLSVGPHLHLVTMYTSELPARLVEQVTKMGDRAFLAIKETHHLLTGGARKKKSGQPYHYCSIRSNLSSYHDVSSVPSRGCSTHVTEQRLGGNGTLRAWDLVSGRFVADE